MILHLDFNVKEANSVFERDKFEMILVSWRPEPRQDLDRSVG